MKFLIVLSAFVAVGLARPGALLTSLPYATTLLAYAKLVPGAPIGHDGRVVDTPEVSYAKAEHAAAHINEKFNLANEAVKSADYVAYAAAPVAAAPLVAATYAGAPVAAAPFVAATYAAAPAVALTKYTAGGAPIGLDGRVVDTPEVSYAKAEHAAAHINEKLELANEAVKSADYVAYAVAPVAAAPLVATTYAAAAAPALTLTKYTAGGAPIGLDGRVVDTPEVSYAKAEHAAAHINERIEQGQQHLRNALHSSPLLVSSYSAPAYATGYLQHYY